MISKNKKTLIRIGIFFYFSILDSHPLFAQVKNLSNRCGMLLNSSNTSSLGGAFKVKLERPFGLQPILTKEIEYARMENFKPLQMTLGRALINFKTQSILEEADLVRRATGTDLKTAVSDIIKREASVGLVVYRDPEGYLRPVDGHHKLAMILDLAECFNIQSSEVSILVDLKKENDFLENKWQSFVLSLEDAGFLNNIDKSKLGDSDLKKEFDQQIAKDFHQMEDSASRSTLSRIFDIIDIKGADFKPMVQKKLVNFLQNEGVRIQPGEEFQGAVIGKILNILYLDNGQVNPKVSKIFSEEVLEKSKVAVMEDLQTFGVHFAKISKSLKAGLDFIEVDFNSGKMLVKNEKLGKSDGNAEKVEFLERLGNLFLGLSDFNIRILPRKNSIPDNKEFFESLLENDSLVEAPFKLEKLKEILKKISEKDFKESDRSDRRSLKKFRIYTLKVRALYQFISKEHEEPKSLHEFSFDLGLLNDLLDKWSKEKEGEKKVSKLAKKLLSQLDDRDLNFDLDFKISKFKGKNGIRNYIEELNNEIRELLQQNYIKVGEYHWIRRRIRSFGIFFETIASADEQVEAIILNSFLEKVSDRMGLVKDGLLTSEWSDKVKDPDNQKTQIDDKTKKMLLAFSNLIRQ